MIELTRFLDGLDVKFENEKEVKKYSKSGGTGQLVEWSSHELRWG